MKPIALSLFAAVLATPTSEHTLRYSPADGSSFSRALSWSHTAETTATQTTLGGEPTNEVPTLRYKATRGQEVRVIDRLELIGDGRPDRFVRAYTHLLDEYSAKLEMELMGQKAKLESAGDGTSELEGLEVRFRWSQDAGKWAAEWADPDQRGRDTLLLGLHADMDFLALLPEKPVDVGDSWEVPLSGLVHVLFPGGELSIDLETDLEQIEGALDPADMPTIADILRKGEVEGTARCVLKSVDGEKAVVDMELDITATAAFAERLDKVAGNAAPEGVEVSVDVADFTAKIVGAGTYSFGLTTGFISEFKFDAETEEESSIEATVLTNGESLPFGQTHSRKGELQVRSAVE